MRIIFVRKNKKDLNKNVTVRNNMISKSNARPTAKLSNLEWLTRRSSASLKSRTSRGSARKTKKWLLKSRE
jgi:hypothetical protein